MTRKVKPIDAQQKYCSPRQAAKALGVSEYLIYHQIDSIPHRVLGTRILIPVDWVNGEAS
jgi:hypothetical protein